MPASTSFPSGHSASGFAFAAAIGRDQPWLGFGLRFLAAAVAYSRVHTGVHYPGDAVAGALIGEGMGQAVAIQSKQVAQVVPDHGHIHMNIVTTPRLSRITLIRVTVRSARYRSATAVTRSWTRRRRGPADAR